ncbi:3-ketoacyl-CoA thiolase with broad chain length specificity [Vanrija albida]|uniref:3-ketoacyl-CoA thiolase with broad chain length specificity n=1 Tax=Vanrija albida TaxID=181172 RepID=A0ABR3PZY1_9TREE
MTKASILQKNPDDVVILSAKRTALTRAKKGALAEARYEDLLSAVLKGAVDAAHIDPKLIEDIQIGTVRTPRGGASISRMAALHAGIPISATLSTVNRQCSSSLQAIWTIANEIHAGDIDIGIAGGAESMTHHFVPKPLDHPHSEEIVKNQLAADCLIPMGITNENVVEENHISRQKQDEFAASSYQKAEAAQNSGKFDGEIVPVTINGKTVTKDDGIRYGVTAESLSKVKPAFKADGTTHAGNASQVTDGAAACVLARRSVAERLGLPIIGKVVRVVAAGVPPRIMGIGPAVAIPKVLEKEGLKVSDVDVFEVNEAFAGQAVYCAEKLKIPPKKLNPNGGAIALGHPLGATGARQVATGLAELQRSGDQILVTSMCAGTGYGVAGLFVNEVTNKAKL